MSNHRITCLLAATVLFTFSACKKDDDTSLYDGPTEAINAAFGGRIDVNNLPNYANQFIPDYITKDNTEGNFITDEGATLGRVLFYDVNLSVENSISCSSCHQQEHAFSDINALSQGVNGITGRHSMRLINARFADEGNFFWDERAGSLEEQSTMPIKDHAEMGWSGENGDPDMDDLIEKLEGIDYYNELFQLAYGTSGISEGKIQAALSQFIRSIQSFDSKFDEGMAQAPNLNAPFSNFTPAENEGKELFLAPPNFDGNGERIGGGLGCQGCHRAPEFDIDPNSRNNGVIGSPATPGEFDIDVTRSPSLRDVVKQDGSTNGGMMHGGGFQNLGAVINHYNQIVALPANTNLDPRLNPAGNPQSLNITNDEREALIAFLETLAGNNVYVDAKWSSPF